MPRLYSARPDAVTYYVSRGRPLTFGALEMVLPGKPVDIAALAFTDVLEAEAPPILERFGRSGIVLAKPGEADADVIQGAREVRYNFLVDVLTEAQINARMAAANGAVVRPSNKAVRALMKEFNELRKEFEAEDPILQAVLPDIESKADPADDILRPLTPPAHPSGPAAAMSRVPV